MCRLEGDAVSAILYRRQAVPILGFFQGYAQISSNKPDANPRVPFLSSFLKRLKPPSRGLADHLDRTYGALRAPRYIKETEIKNSELTQNGSRVVFYEPTGKSIDESFPDIGSKTLIWVVNQEGTLVIGIEEDGIGHPGLTGSKPARIAGELHRKSKGWEVNSKSGRYSGDYADRSVLLNNAINRFKAYFTDHFVAEP